MKRKGFTLLEILLATAIAAMFSGAVYAVLLRALLDTRRLEETALVNRLGGSILRLIEHDLLACLPAGEGAEHFTGTVDAEGNTLLSFVTATDSRSAQYPSDVIAVTYGLIPDEEARDLFRLYRKESPPAGRIEAPEQDQTVVLADGVRSFAVEYFDGAGWRPVWSEPAVPKAVRVTLELVRKFQSMPGRAAGTQAFSFSTTVVIPQGG